MEETVKQRDSPWPARARDLAYGHAQSPMSPAAGQSILASGSCADTLLDGNDDDNHHDGREFQRVTAHPRPA